MFNQYKLKGKNLNMDYLHTVLSVIDNPITFVKRPEENIINYQKTNKGDFRIIQQEKYIKLSGKISKELKNKLKNHGIKTHIKLNPFF